MNSPSFYLHVLSNVWQARKYGSIDHQHLTLLSWGFRTISRRNFLSSLNSSVSTFLSSLLHLFPYLTCSLFPLLFHLVSFLRLLHCRILSPSISISSGLGQMPLRIMILTRVYPLMAFQHHRVLWSSSHSDHDRLSKKYRRTEQIQVCMYQILPVKLGSNWKIGYWRNGLLLPDDGGSKDRLKRKTSTTLHGGYNAEDSHLHRLTAVRISNPTLNWF